ncbi:MAG TPA: hypothetical protein VIK35_08500 [Verrucomicrobiae bacterium]
MARIFLASILAVSHNAVSYYGSWQTNNFSTYYVPLNEAYADNVESTEYGTSPPYVEETRKSDVHVKLKLKTGGPPGSTQKNLWDISGTLNGGGSPPHEMAIGSFGNLDTNGNAYALLPDNSPPIDVTPSVAGMNSYFFQLNQPTKYTLTHTTECTATGNTNNSRTTIGICESVDFAGMPGGTTWSVSGEGFISSTNGSSTVFTAKMSPGSATVTATIGNATLPTTFQTPNTRLTWPNGTNSTLIFNESTNAWGVSCEIPQFKMISKCRWFQSVTYSTEQPMWIFPFQPQHGRINTGMKTEIGLIFLHRATPFNFGVVIKNVV